MKKLAICAAFCGAILASQVAAAATFNEIGDAGQTSATAQIIDAGTTSILGSLGTGDNADLYKFSWNGGTFQAATISGNDPMLFLFDSTGTKLAFNDDANGTLQAFISVDIAAGDYLLGINNFSTNYDGDLAGFGIPGNGFGAYEISVSATSAVPEPSVVALLGLGLLGLGMSRRRKAA